jgi:hypothetical protein
MVKHILMARSSLACAWGIRRYHNLALLGAVLAPIQVSTFRVVMRAHQRQSTASVLNRQEAPSSFMLTELSRNT